MQTAKHSRRQGDMDSQGRAGKYLIFHLGAEDFGVGVLSVREILSVPEITQVPQTPAYVKGVMNLRGKVLPVIDLRMRFGLHSADENTRGCVIIVRTRQAEGEMPMGVLVDGVSEVLSFNAAEIEDTPAFGPGVATPYLKGMAKRKDKVKILLDIDEVLRAGELAGLAAMLATCEDGAMR